MYVSGKDFGVAQSRRLAYSWSLSQENHRERQWEQKWQRKQEGEQEKRSTGFRQFLLVRCITIIDNYNFYKGHQGLDITLESFYLPIVQRLHWMLQNSKSCCSLGPTPGQPTSLLQPGVMTWHQSVCKVPQMVLMWLQGWNLLAKPPLLVCVSISPWLPMVLEWAVWRFPRAYSTGDIQQFQSANWP